MRLAAALKLKTHDERRRFAVFCVGYIFMWLCCWYSARLMDVSGGASLWFLPAGLRFSAYWLIGWLAVPVELAAVLLVNSVQLLTSASRLDGLFNPQAFWFVYDSLALPCIYALVVMPVRSRLHARLDLTQPLDSVIFIGLAASAAALGAVGGTIHLIGVGLIAPEAGPRAIFDWFVGDLVGILALTPLLFMRVWPQIRKYLEKGTWKSNPAPDRIGSLQISDHQDVHTTLICLIGLILAFGIPTLWEMDPNLPTTALFLLLPLGGIAMFYGLRSVALATALLETGLMFMLVVFDHGAMIRQYQLVMISLALVGLWLGGAVGARKRLMARYLDFARVSNDLLWETDQNGQLMSAHGRLAGKFNAAIGKSWRDLLFSGPHPHMHALEQAIRERAPLRRIELQFANERNEPRWIELNAVPIHNDSGDCVGYRGTATDVTRAHRAKMLMRDYNKSLLAKVSQRTSELRLANEELAFKKRHMQVLLAAAPVGVLEFDENSRCRYLNANATTLTNRSAEQALGRHLIEFVHPNDRDRVQTVWQQTRTNVDVQHMDFRLSRSDLWCSACWINVSEPGLLTESGAIVVLNDATLRHQQEEQLWALAHHDALTGLPNRNLFWDRCAQALSLSKRHDTCAAVLWIDLDGFKAVNDSLGHAAGDALLQEVARRLKNRVRDSDTVARMGGDEFGIVMPDILDTEALTAVANGLLDTLNQPYLIEQNEARISGSIGIAIYPEHAEAVETLTKYADMAMYHAKHAGKNQVQMWRDTCFVESMWANSGYSTF